MINTFSLLPQYFEIGAFRIYSYGIIVALSILVLYIFARERFEKKGFSEGTLDLIFISSFFGGLIGGRLMYLLLHLEDFSSRGLVILVDLRGGGIHLFGVILGAILASSY